MKEMTDQTRMIVFVVLVVAITFIWSHFFTPAVPPASQQKPAIVSGQTAPVAIRLDTSSIGGVGCRRFGCFDSTHDSSGLRGKADRHR